MTYARSTAFLERLAFGIALLLLALVVTAPPIRAQEQGSGSASVGTATQASAEASWELRVCGDPNNLPYSNEAGEGFENRIAEILADELDAELTYFWYPQRRGLVRRVLRKGECDMLLGVPSGYEMVGTTRPYYRSGFAFIYREDAPFELGSLQDEALDSLRIGVHVQEPEGLNPPAVILSQRGLTENMVGFGVYGDYNQPNPLRAIVDSVATGSIDVAVVWGPPAGYFAQQETVPLVVKPVLSETEPPPARRDDDDEREDGEAEEGDDDDDISLSAPPLALSISMGMRRGDASLQAELDRAIARRWDDIRAVLEEYNVPLLPLATPSPAETSSR